MLVIDNYDSFVYNLVQYLGELGAEPVVHRHDALAIDELVALEPDAVLVSPGPGDPGTIPRTPGCRTTRSGCSARPASRCSACASATSASASSSAGEIVRAPQVMHGKTSQIAHDGKGVFRDVPTPFTATRYHSLVVERDSVPDVLEVSAESEDGLVMGLRHRELPIEGVQFHPESILTEARPRPSRQTS